jgi:hydrogenase maturation protease
MNASPKILIAGIGNIFFGDDAFGCEVARRCAARAWPEGVRTFDFGIRGLDLAYALFEGYDATILVDAVCRRAPVGSLFLIRPELDDAGRQGASYDGHTMQPEKTLLFARSIGADVSRVLLLGCEPAPFTDEEQMQDGLSAAVEEAAGRAVTLLELLVDYLRGEGAGDLALEGFRPPSALFDPAGVETGKELAT